MSGPKKMLANIQKLTKSQQAAAPMTVMPSQQIPNQYQQGMPSPVQQQPDPNQNSNIAAIRG